MWRSGRAIRWRAGRRWRRWWRALPELPRREEWLRVDYEHPARAEAKEQELARLACSPKEVALLRAQRGHEQVYQRASGMLLKARKALAAQRPRPGSTRGVVESPLIPTLIARQDGSGGVPEVPFREPPGHS
jgi:hypothetical protein